MNLLKRLLNLSDDLFQGDTTWQVKFVDAWAHPALVFLAAAALIALVAALYWRETRRLSLPVRMALGVIRLAVVLTILAAVFSPTLIVKTEKRDKSQVLLLVDQSGSMSIQDNYEAADADGVAAALQAAGVPAATGKDIAGMKRIDIANKLATFLRDKLRAKKDFDVAVYSFAERLSAIDEGAEGAKAEPIQVPASGERTEMGTALSQLLGRYRGQDLSALVVLSDGCNNAGFLPSSAADTAKELGLPIYALGIGNPKHPKDIQVVSLIANDTLLVNDPADFATDIHAWGYGGPDGAGEEAEVVLSEKGEGEPSREVARKKIRLLPDGQRVPVTFEYTPDKVGEKIFRVEIKPRPDESRTDNNSESIAVSVIEATLRTLYVSGEPTWEYRVLSRALIQDKMIHAACWLQSADPQFTQDGDESLDKLPDSLDLLVRHEKPPSGGATNAPAEPAKTGKEYVGYDVVILAGIDPADIKEKFAKAVVSFVRDHGGGVMFMAGQRMTPYMLKNSRGEEFLSLLPIEIEETHDTSDYGKRLFADEFRLRLTPEGLGMRMTHLAGTPEESKKLWEQTLPGFYWYYPVKRAKPGAVVVAVHDKEFDLATRSRAKDRRPMPIIAHHFFGKGRVMYVGVDSTWRWRKEVGDKYFAKFWSQALHYLGKGSLLKKLGGVTIATDKPEYVVGETVTMSARVVDEATLEPSAQDRYTALIQKADSGVAPEETTLAGTGEKGRYEGAWKAKERGTYHAWLRMEGKKEEKPGLRRFEVQLPAREKGDVRIDEKTLISVVTRGGAFLPPSRLGEMAKIPEQVKPVAEARVVQKTQTLWDAAGPLALLVGLLIAEWILRKQKGLA